MTAILVGFQYSGSHFLPGILMDLYFACEWCTLRNLDYHVLTDMSEDRVVDGLSLLSNFIEGTVNESIFELISTLQKHERYTLISSKTEFDFHLQNVKISEELIFYFSGHGVPEGMRLPNGEVMEWKSLLFLLRNKGRRIVWIQDCCFCTSLDLPYYYPFPSFISKEYGNKDDPFILGIFATGEQKKTWCSKDGSSFSRTLFSLFSRNVYDLDTLYHLISGISIRSSHLTSHIPHILSEK